MAGSVLLRCAERAGAGESPGSMLLLLAEATAPASAAKPSSAAGSSAAPEAAVSSTSACQDTCTAWQSVSTTAALRCASSAWHQLQRACLPQTHLPRQRPQQPAPQRTGTPAAAQPLMLHSRDIYLQTYGDTDTGCTLASVTFKA